MIFLTLFLNNLNANAFLKAHLRRESSPVTPGKFIPHELSYIKPFTALVRFNRKHKEPETKNLEQKIAFPNFPLLHLKLF
ncbi:hypothetical protein CNR22_11295 [Sphingobacteriaceae bacterium]|nr:hypothetical protein CNR22_11295 [Sphingobacteriaceae bacterium]